MGKWKERILYELSKEPQKRKLYLRDLAKRLLLGFFVMLLLLTAVSRAADSVTVAKVETARVRSGILSYEITGSGTIKANAEKYLDLYEGARIKAIAVEAGQPVSEGELLFSYDVKELMEVRESLENELAVAQLNLEKERLSYETGAADAAASETQAAEIGLRRARLDLTTAEQDLETAKNKIDEDKKKELDAAKEAYSDAVKAKAEKEEDREEALKQAEKEVTKAAEALNELYADKRKAEAVLADYKTAALISTTRLIAPLPDSTAGTDGSDVNDNLSFNEEDYSINNINDSFYGMLNKVFDKTGDAAASEASDPLSVAEINIFIQYYGKDGYESHTEEVQKARQTLARAKEDYLLVFIEAAESGVEISTAQKSACIRAYQDAAEALDKLTRKDAELDKAILSYGAAVQSKVEADVTSTYNILFPLLYQEDEDKLKEIRAAAELIESGQEAVARLTKEWNRNMEKAEEEVASAEEALNTAQEAFGRIFDGAYDYTADIRALEGQAESARRSVEDAEINLAKAKDNDTRTLAAKNSEKQLEQLDTRLYELDIRGKKEAVDKVEELLNRDGQVYAPVSGSILCVDLSVGSKIAGTEKVSISLDSYGFYTEVTGDEAKRLGAGDEISIRLNNSRKNITTVIESIGPEDSKGMAEVTAILPEGEYIEGAAVTFSVSKRSEQYTRTIPLQAVRLDANNVNYVLVIGESNTILGNELTAYRRNVTVLDKDYQTAAVETDLGPEDRIIIGSSKNIEEGDRVRINEGNE